MTKRQICQLAYNLVQALNACDDADFVDDIVGAVGCNDDMTLMEMYDEQEEE